MNLIELGKRIENSLKARKKTYATKLRAQLKSGYTLLKRIGSVEAVIWIFGCQRSGTTFIENTFRHDLNSAVFGEFSELTIGERKTVLDDLSVVKDKVLKKNAQYAVIKPLFESDRAIELLNLFPNSVGVWLFRDCPHVVDSMIRKWGQRFFEISQTVESDESGLWRLEEAWQNLGQPMEVDLPIAEIYARYWLLRNNIPFENGLDKDPRMVFLSYQTLISSHRSCVDSIMQRVALPGVWKGFRSDARVSNLNSTVNPSISFHTNEMCAVTYGNLLSLERRSFPGSTEMISVCHAQSRNAY